MQHVFFFLIGGLKIFDLLVVFTAIHLWVLLCFQDYPKALPDSSAFFGVCQNNFGALKKSLGAWKEEERRRRRKKEKSGVFQGFMNP